MRRRPIVWLATLQGLFYVATGVWGLVDLASFEAVTGPKTDDWLVRTVSILVLVIGSVLLVAAARLRVPFEVALLAVGSALGLTVVDVVYATTGVISDVYLLDAAAEVLLALAWGVALWLDRGDPALWGRSLQAPPTTRGGRGSPK